MSPVALNIKGLVAACVYLRSGLRSQRVAAASFSVGSGRLQPGCDSSFHVIVSFHVGNGYATMVFILNMVLLGCSGVYDAGMPDSLWMVFIHTGRNSGKLLGRSFQRSCDIACPVWLGVRDNIDAGIACGAGSGYSRNRCDIRCRDADGQPTLYRACCGVHAWTVLHGADRDRCMSHRLACCIFLTDIS